MFYVTEFVEKNCRHADVEDRKSVFTPITRIKWLAKESPRKHQVQDPKMRANRVSGRLVVYIVRIWLYRIAINQSELKTP